MGGTTQGLHPKIELPLVPRARIELATQGFSVLRSTTELPRHDKVLLLYDYFEINQVLGFYKKTRGPSLRVAMKMILLA